MFGVIQTRYKECQGKNQVDILKGIIISYFSILLKTVIEKIQRLSVQLLPIVASTRNGKGVVSKSLAPIFAISLVTSMFPNELENKKPMSIIVFIFA